MGKVQEMTQYGFYYNNHQCSGCRTCQVACKDKNNLQGGVLFRKVMTYETGSYPNPGYFHVSISCNQCAQPACTEVCPTGAMEKNTETGIVMHDDEKCIGCESCAKACPYEQPRLIESLGIVQKCTLCHDHIARGENPVCVDACPLRALEWGKLDDLKSKHPEAISSIVALPDESQTNPSLLIDARTSALESNPVQRFI